MNRLPVIAAALAAASFSIAAPAAIYRWVDSDGHVHYTDRAVPNSELVDVHTGEVKTGDEPAADANLPADQLALKKSQCEQKKKQYASYKTAIKIVETDSLGRQHEYTDDEMKMLIAKTQQAMLDACNAAGMGPTALTTPEGSTAPAQAPQQP
jgi:hypothetical protein